MAINLGMKMDVGMRQQLKLTPQLQQAILLLQMNQLELVEKIQEYADENPFLEVEQTEPAKSVEATADASTQDEYSISADIATGTYQQSSGIGGTDDMFANMVYDESIKDYLNGQVDMASFNPKEKMIALTIIDLLADDGYLHASIDEIATSLLATLELNIAHSEIEAVLSTVQRFDPVGVAARDTQECLRVQLELMPEGTPGKFQALMIVQRHFNLFIEHRLTQLASKASLQTGEFELAMNLIKSLRLYPGKDFVTSDEGFVRPDVMVQKVKNKWVIKLNEHASPKLSINAYYSSISKQAKTESDQKYMQKNLQEAKWLIKSLEKRHDTLSRVASFIVAKQQDFFTHGKQQLKPMVIKEVAQALELHDSTISRITTNKFIATPQGMLELKYFFSSSLTTSDGESCSSKAVRSMIAEMVAGEVAIKPLTDSDILAKLETAGINVARRTIAKYRKALNIPAVSKRKLLAKNMQMIAAAQ
jgi:RNA polymerase sigma-54 factor